MFSILLLMITGMALTFGRKKQKGSCAKPWPKTLRLTGGAGNGFDGGDVDVACVAGVKTRIGSITVPEQTYYIWGRDSRLVPELMGVIFGDLNAAGPTDLTGTLIVEAMNANDRNPIPLGEYDLDALRAQLTDPTKQVKVPLEDNTMIGPNSKLVFYLRLVSTQTFDYGLSTLTMNCVTACG